MPNLLVIGGVLTGNVFPLEDDEITIGREGDNTIGVPDPALSRRHCALTREPSGWRVRDLGSSNGTFVNGLQVQSQLLAEGDHVTAGASVGHRASASQQLRRDEGWNSLPLQCPLEGTGR